MKLSIMTSWIFIANAKVFEKYHLLSILDFEVSLYEIIFTLSQKEKLRPQKSGDLPKIIL